jgi:hypothetical protein
MSFLQKLFGGGKQLVPADPGLTGNTAAGSMDECEVPYCIADRPMPQGGDLDVLLAQRVGPYVREPLKAPANKREPIYANYRSGTAAVFVELDICDDPSEAQEALSTAKAETDAEFPGVPYLFTKRGDIRCLRTLNRLGAFMAWTRGRYYFSAHAKAGEKDLDDFMTAFSY